jgi:hypothetical protein
MKWHEFRNKVEQWYRATHNITPEQALVELSNRIPAEYAAALNAFRKDLGDTHVYTREDVFAALRSLNQCQPVHLQEAEAVLQFSQLRRKPGQTIEQYRLTFMTSLNDLNQASVSGDHYQTPGLISRWRMSVGCAVPLSDAQGNPFTTLEAVMTATKDKHGTTAPPLVFLQDTPTTPPPTSGKKGQKRKHPGDTRSATPTSPSPAVNKLTTLQSTSNSQGMGFMDWDEDDAPSVQFYNGPRSGYGYGGRGGGGWGRGGAGGVSWPRGGGSGGGGSSWQGQSDRTFWQYPQRGGWQGQGQAQGQGQQGFQFNAPRNQGQQQRNKKQVRFDLRPKGGKK